MIDADPQNKSIQHNKNAAKTAPLRLQESL